MPEALVNFLALIGWAPDGETTIMTRDEIVERFILEAVSASAGTFDFAKLDWMNGVYLRALSPQEYADRLVVWVGEQGYDWPAEDVSRGGRDRAGEDLRLGEFPEFAGFLFQDVEPDPALLDALSCGQPRAPWQGSTTWSAAAIEERLKALCDELGQKPRQVFGPIRVAVTGSRISPGLYESPRAPRT